MAAVLVVVSGGCGEAQVASTARSSTTTTTTAPSQGARVGTATVVAGAAVPAEGFVVVDGDRLVIADEKGKVIAEGNGEGFFSNDHGHPLGLVVDGPQVRLEESPRTPVVSDQFPSDCIAELAADVVPNLARCGPSESKLRRIDVVDAGGHRTLIETPPLAGATEVLGHWRSAELSPDGTWVLALWSGECESPTAFLLPVGRGEAVTVDGTPLRSWPSAPESVPAGWTSDGRARFAVGAGACGTGLPERGVYAIEPGGKPELLYRAEARYPTAYAWRMMS